MSFENKSVFLVPFWFKEMKKLSRLDSDLWKQIEKDNLKPSYLLRYASDISQQDDKYRAFLLNDKHLPDLYMYEDRLKLDCMPALFKIRMSCFGTGVGFLEFWINYGELPPEQIINFVYFFKKTAPKNHTKQTVYDVAEKLLSPIDKIQLFFTETSKEKYECNCFHMLQFPDLTPDSRMDEWLQLLGRNFNFGFKALKGYEESKFDMLYKPYEYDMWGASQTGIVNICTLADNAQAIKYYSDRRPKDLSVDYLFMYLLLLNQRYGAIRYIEKMAYIHIDTLKKGHFERVNAQIIKLKTIYSFRIISNDMVYQNIYSKLYMILDIDHLLEDIKENEDQAQEEQEKKRIKRETTINTLLSSIAFLSVASVLIDLTSYLSLWPISEGIAKIISAFVVVATSIVLIVTIYIRGKNKY